MKLMTGIRWAVPALALSMAVFAPAVQAARMAPTAPPPGKSAGPKPGTPANNSGCSRSNGQGVSRC